MCFDIPHRPKERRFLLSGLRRPFGIWYRATSNAETRTCPWSYCLSTREFTACPAASMYCFAALRCRRFRYNHMGFHTDSNGARMRELRFAAAIWPQTEHSRMLVLQISKGIDVPPPEAAPPLLLGIPVAAATCWMNQVNLVIHRFRIEGQTRTGSISPWP